MRFLLGLAFALVIPAAVRAAPIEQIDALAHWRDSALFDARAHDVLAYAEAMTLQVQVGDELFNAVRRHFDARELVELTATVASYNMVSRFLEALRIEIEA